MMDFAPFILTLKLATLTTFLLFLVGIPLAYWLAYSKYRIKLAFSPENQIGKFLDQYFDLRLVFTFHGLVLASVIYSLPFMVQPLRSGFSGIPNAWLDAAKTMGKSSWATLFRILLPNMKNALITAGVLTFAHTIGEFGVVLMVGGNIPEETRVISVAIYNEVEGMNYAMANQYSLLLIAFSFTVLLLTYLINHRKNSMLSYD